MSEYAWSTTHTRSERITCWMKEKAKNVIIVILSVSLLLSIGVFVSLAIMSSKNEPCTTQTTTPKYKGDNVLAIWSKSSNGVPSALVTDFNGNVKQINWSAGSDTTAYGSCSVLFKDSIYFLGEV